MIIEEKDTSSSVPDGDYQRWEENDMHEPSLPDTSGSYQRSGKQLRIEADTKSPQSIKFNINVKEEEKRNSFEILNARLRKAS